MNREKKLIRNTVILTIGKLSTQFISFFLLPIYTSVLSTSEYGIVDLLTTYISLLVPLITLQIEQALFRYLVDIRKTEKRTRNSDNKRIQLITTVMLSTFIQSIAYMIIFIIVSNFIKNDYKYFLATNVIACVFSSIMLQITRGLGDNVTYTIGSFITAVSTIILNILFLVIFKFGAYGMLIAALSGNLFCVLFIFFKKNLIKYIQINSFDFKLLKNLYKYSIPLVPNSLSWWVINVSDRTLISIFLGTAANGIYAVSTKFPSIFTSFYGIFNLTWTESASEHIDDGDRDAFFTNIFNISFKVFLAACLIILTVLPILFPFLINKNFDDAYYQIPILMVGSLCSVTVSLFGVIYIAKKLTKEVAKTTIFSAIINIGFNLVLIKYIGLYAASISTALSYFLMALYRYFDVKKYVNIKLDKKVLLSSIVMIAILFITYYKRILILSIIVLVITVAYSIFINISLVTKIGTLIIKKNIFLNLFKGKFIFKKKQYKHVPNSKPLLESETNKAS